jgi:hypothetical protein
VSMVVYVGYVVPVSCAVSLSIYLVVRVIYSAGFAAILYKLWFAQVGRGDAAT